MKTITKLFPLALLTAATMISCNNKVSTEEQNDKVAVQFGGSIEVTRAVNDKWTDGDLIGIFMVGGNQTLSKGSIMENADNIAYGTDGSGAFSPVNEDEIIYFPDNEGEVDFYAYSPHTTAVNDYRLAIDLTDQSNQDALDLMYATVRGCNRSKPQVELKFSHQLSRLVLEVQPGKGLTQDDLAKLTVKVKDVDTKATFNLDDGLISGEETPEGITMKTIEVGKRYEAILLPTTSTSREIEFSLNNDPDASFARTFTWTMESDIKGGCKYSYTVTLSRTSANVSGSIKPWEDGGDNGEHEAK